MQKWAAQLRKGLVEMAVLAALADGEAYGYQLLQRMKQADGLGVTESTVYPLLTRLAGDGYIKVRAAPSPSGPPRRYYRLTSLGRSRLREMAEHWQGVRNSIDALIEGASHDDG
jgi:PadR family transcriptional regulator PadR